MTAPGGFDQGDVVQVRAVWVDEASGGLRALRAEATAATQTFARAAAPAHAFGQAIAGLAQREPAATQSTTRLRSALIGLSTATVGLPGAFGRVASSFLLLGTGGAATVALLGGAALASAAIDRIGKSSKEARERHEELLESLRKRAGEVSPAARGEEQAEREEAARRRIAAINVEIANLEGKTLRELGLQGEELRKHELQEREQINVLLKERNELGLGILATQKDTERSISNMAVTLEAISALPTPAWFAREAVRGIQIPAAEIPRGIAIRQGPDLSLTDPTIGLGRPAADIARDVFALSPARQAIADVRREAGVLAIAMTELDGMLERGEISATEHSEAQRRLAAATDTAGAASERAARTMISAAAALAGSLAAGRSGGPLGILGGLASVAGGFLGVTPLGAALTIGGAALSGLASRRRDEPIQVRDPVVASKLDAIREQIVPEPMFVFEFRDPTSPENVKRFVAAANRVRSRDGLPVVSVPLAVFGMEG